MTAAPAYTIVLDWLEAELRSGAVVVGDKLPGERTLAERFGISRASVREATRMLEAMGLIRASAGSGPNSGAVVVSEPSAALGWALRLHIATRSLPMADVVAARVLLETDAAQAAAATSGDPESVAVLAEVETLLDRMDDPALPEEDFHLLDTEFHVRLATLGGNVVTAMMLDSLRQATIGYVTETVAGLSDGDVAMLENVRYEPGEESKDEAERGALADRYAALGDVFVSDGFGVVHRK